MAPTPNALTPPPVEVVSARQQRQSGATNGRRDGPEAAAAPADRAAVRLGERGLPGGRAGHVAGVPVLQRQAGRELVDAGGANAGGWGRVLRGTGRQRLVTIQPRSRARQKRRVRVDDLHRHPVTLDVLTSSQPETAGSRSNRWS